MAVTFIGDVHGWPDRLDAVLAQCQGPLVFMGDLIDRGPDTPGVIDRVRTLVGKGRARCLLGNHEYALLRGLGAPSIALEPDSGWWGLWRDRHGGRAVLRDYQVDDANGLRRALGADTIGWLASLPWCIEGDGWLAVHAGLRPDESFDMQLHQLRDGWRFLRDTPDHLYDKSHVLELPHDVPQDVVVVSGHTPLPQVHISPERILCDTSGGLPGRRLSAVSWPDGRIVTSDQ